MALNVINNLDVLRAGEELNIVGFLRLPMENLNKNINIDNIYANTESEIIQLNKNEVIHTLHHPNKLLIYLLPLGGKVNIDDAASMISSVIPSFDDIINYYEGKYKCVVNRNLAET